MDCLVKDINSQAKNNAYFRQVLQTGKNTQVVIMSIPAGEDIGMEVHPDNDQVLYLLSGQGKVVINGEEADFAEGDLALVNAGNMHDFINTGDQPMKIITTYSPPHHPVGTIHKTKEEAEKAEY